MNTQVYHERDFNPILERERTFPDDFLLVAEIETDDVDEAFHLTNHIDYPWWENQGVRKVVEQQVRSTSSGDVVVLPNGRVLACRSVGWTDIGNVADQPLKFQTKLVTFGDNCDEGQ